MLPGTLVVKRIRWDIDSRKIGMVVCNDPHIQGCLVLWSGCLKEEGATLMWQLNDMLEEVSNENR